MNRKVAVIGTGAAGLSAAAHLARKGIEVFAFEQSPHIGGLLNPFERNGYEFAPGVHYVGRCGPQDATGREFVRMGLDPTELFARMDDDFDVYRFPDFEIAMCSGLERYRERLHAAFPHDVEGVDRVMNALAHLSAALDLQRPGRHAIGEYLEAAGSVSLIRWMNATFADFLDWACSDARLKSVFAASCGDYGLPPSRSSAAMGLSVLAHYIHGAHFPRGGAGALRDAILGVSTRHGATFRFQDRRDAGRRLARELASYAHTDPVVVALPRGGVPVAFEVARALSAPLDVCVVRKLGVPWHPELGVGAVAEGGYVYINRRILSRVGMSEDELEQLIEAKTREVADRVRRYRGSRPRMNLSGRTVILVDDGIATGGTVRTAIDAIRAQNPLELVLAVPVAAPDTIHGLGPRADHVVALLTPEEMYAIGLWYDEFDQVPDADVVRLLDEAIAKHDSSRGEAQRF